MKTGLRKKSIAMLLCVMMVTSMTSVSAMARDLGGAAVEGTVSVSALPLEEGVESAPEETEVSAETEVSVVTDNPVKTENLAYVAEDAEAPMHDGSTSGTCGEDLTWSLSAEGVLTITGTGSMDDYDCNDGVIFPWYDCSNKIQSVVIEEGVTSIGSDAFYNINSIQRVSIPSTVTVIAGDAFEACFGLTEFFVNSGNSVFANDDEGVLYSADMKTLIEYPNGKTGSYVVPAGVTTIGYGSFSLCDDLELALPAGLTTIEGWAFNYCSGLKSITIPDTVTSIGDGAFQACDQLTEVTIPANVREIYSTTFNACENLEKITVAEENRYYTSVDGVLFTKDMTELMTVPNQKSGDYIIPNGVTTIMDGAFCENALNSLTIPTSVTLIHPFALCPVPDVYYLGSKAQWESINRVVLMGDPLEDATIHYAYGNYLSASLYELTLDNFQQGAAIHYSVYGELPEEYELWYTLYDAAGDVLYGAGALDISWGAWSGTQIPLFLEMTGCGGFTLVVKLYDSSLEITDENALDYATTKIKCLDYRCGDDLLWCENDGVLTISGTGAMPDYDALTAPWSWLDTAAIKSVVIAPSVTSIGKNAFETLPALEQVVIPKSVESIGDRAFLETLPLKTVNYEGSESDWAAIEIGDYNDALDNAEINYDYEVSANTPWSGVCGDNLTWELSLTGELTISGTGAMYDYGYDFESDCWIDQPWVEQKYNISTVVIEEGVTSIGYNAFYELENLKGIYVPATVTSIAFDAMDYCSMLAGIWVDEGNEVYASSEDGVLFSKDMKTLIRCPGGKTGAYEIPDGVTTIGGYSFFACSYVKPVLPKSLITIEEDAFYLCESIQSIDIPASVTSIGTAAFMECYALESIAVAADNKNYASVDGVLYSKDGTILVAVPTAKSGSFVIPYGVTTIKSFAFAGNEINSITIPTSVSAIYEAALMLRSYINGEFWLKDIYYLGDETQWAAIDIGESNSFILDEATIHYAQVIESEDDTIEVSSPFVDESMTLVIALAEDAVQEDIIVDLGEGASTAYDIKLLEDGEEVQPEGMVQVRLKVPDGYDGANCKVYHLENGELVDMNAVHEEGYLCFETDGFSPYIVHEKKPDSLIGDVNEDEEITIADAVRIARYDAGYIELIEAQFAAADVNGDDEVTIADAVRIARYDAGYIDEL